MACWTGGKISPHSPAEEVFAQAKVGLVGECQSLSLAHSGFRLLLINPGPADPRKDDTQIPLVKVFKKVIFGRLIRFSRIDSFGCKGYESIEIFYSTSSLPGFARKTDVGFLDRPMDVAIAPVVCYFTWY